MAMIPISFEFYPPKTDEQRELLDRTAKRLKPHARNTCRARSAPVVRR
jgi:methylenetetrahydrofolate reductase (NADPH)